MILRHNRIYRQLRARPRLLVAALTAILVGVLFPARLEAHLGLTFHRFLESGSLAISLVGLCERAGIAFAQTAATGLDLAHDEVLGRSVAIKRIDPDLPVANLHDPASLAAALESLQ